MEKLRFTNYRKISAYIVAQTHWKKAISIPDLIATSLHSKKFLSSIFLNAYEFRYQFEITPLVYILGLSLSQYKNILPMIKR